MKNSTLWVVIIIVLLILGGWFWYSGQTAQAPSLPSGAAGINGSENQGNLGQPDNGQGTVQQPSDSSAQGDGTGVSANLILGVSGDGSYLTAFNGMTLYTYSKDTKGASNCSGQCAVNWPPYTVPSADAVHVSSVFSASDVGTITRADGTLQITYKGNPLYYYIKDTKPGDTTGSNVGGVWFLVQK